MTEEIMSEDVGAGAVAADAAVMKAVKGIWDAELDLKACRMSLNVERSRVSASNALVAEAQERLVIMQRLVAEAEAEGNQTSVESLRARRHASRLSLGEIMDNRDYNRGKEREAELKLKTATAAKLRAVAALVRLGEGDIDP